MTKDELKEIIQECIDEINEAQIEEMTKEEPINIESVNEDSNIEMLDEGFLFISKDGKELKKSIQNLLKEKRVNTGFAGAISNCSYGEAEAVLKRISPDLRKLFSFEMHDSNVLKVVTHSDYGTTTCFYTSHASIKDNKLYAFALRYFNGGAALYSFTETELAKSTVPIDAAKFAIKNARKDHAVSFRKKAILVTNIENGVPDRNLYNELAKKYPNTKISGWSIKFK
jgi:hypothetical protein